MWPDPGVMAVLVETDHAVPASPSRGLGGSLEAGGEGRGEDRERNNPQHRGLEPALAGEAEAMGTGTGPFSSLSTPATMFGHQTTEAEKPPGRWCTKPSREAGVTASSQHSPRFLLPPCSSLPMVLGQGHHSVDREGDPESPGQGRKSP